MIVQFLQLLLLIITANSSPIAARLLFKTRFELPVDFNLRLPDGHPLFGASKTWRGILAAVLITTVFALLLGRSALEGGQIGIYVMLGDLVSSFIKRRLGKPASSQAFLLDQVPESIFPAWMMGKAFSLDVFAIVLLTVSFTVLEIVSARIFYRLGIRKHPY